MKHRPRPQFGTIPDPTNDTYGLYRTVLAMKHILDKMMGIDADKTNDLTKDPTGPQRKPSIFVSDQLPQGQVEGDFWLSKQPNSTTLNVYINGDWRVIWQ